jgi:tRNA A37 threonylcarbamoyladenosine modification protein TsaB
LKVSSWSDPAKEAEKLTPEIAKIVKAQDVDRVIVVKGPGPFTALRVGIVTANAIAMNTKAKMIAISTFDLFKAMASSEPFDFIVLNGGGRTLIVSDGNEHKQILAENFVQEHQGKSKKIIADVNPVQKEILGSHFEYVSLPLNFAQVCAKISSAPDTVIVDQLPLLPYYIKEPSIT